MSNYMAQQKVTQPATPISGLLAPGITLRPLQPDDVGLLYAMHGRLSPESVYYRYLQQRPPTLDEIAAHYRLDPAKGAGFVATIQQRDESIVGVAYYVREQGTQHPTAEPGILVEDRFQGQAIGRNLWQQLQQHAQKHQIHQLRVFFHPGNKRMQRLLLGGGLPYAAKVDGGLNEYLVALAQRPQPAPPALAETTLIGTWHSRCGQLVRRWQLAPQIPSELIQA